MNFLWLVCCLFLYMLDLMTASCFWYEHVLFECPRHAFASALACAKEAYAVARAKGLQLDFDDVEAYVRKFGDTVRKAKPSVLQDIEAGRSSEIEFINGAIQAEALKVGLTAPTNQVVTNLVRSRER